MADDVADHHELLKAEEVGELLEVDASTVRRWINSGYLPAVQLPGLRPRYRVKRSDAEALKARAVTPG